MKKISEAQFLFVVFGGWIFILNYRNSDLKDENKRLTEENDQYKIEKGIIPSDSSYTIKPGWTKKEVIELKGMPDRKFDLGDYLIFRYKNMFVSFRDNIVVLIKWKDLQIQRTSPPTKG